MSSVLSKTPILRIVFPFTLGIIFSYYLCIPTIYTITTTLLCIMAFFIFSKFEKIKFKQKYIYSIFITISCFCLGIINKNITTPETSCISNGTEYIGEASIIKITDNDFSSNTQLQLTCVTDSCGIRTNVRTKITAWIEYNNYSLTEGDIILFRFIPQKLKNRGNPEEFDYAGYLSNKGFTHHTFIRNNEYTVIGHNDDLFSLCKNYQRKAINVLLNSSLYPETKTFFITILLGDSSLLNDDTKEQFSYAGIAHILALSGLHIGIISLILSILLYPLDFTGLKQIRFLITLIIIILFAFISGFSVSVLRATIMIGFVIISKIIYRKNTSLNALFIASLIILIVNPLSLFDIGFQFSFLTVFLILLLSKRLSIFSPKQELLYYFSSVVIISVISALGTLWLSAFYFNYISIFSIFSNVLIIPILPIIIGLGLLHLFFLTIGIDSSLINTILNTSYRIISDISQSVSQVSHSYIDNVYVSPWTLCIVFIGLLFLVLFIMRKRIVFFYGIIITLIGNILLSQYENRIKPDSGYVIFNDYAQTSILIFDNYHATHLATETTKDTETFTSKHQKFISKYNINNINTWILNQNSSYYKFPGGKNVAILNSNEIKNLTLSPRIYIDIVIVTRNYYGNISDILRCYNTKLIVFSGDIFHEKLKLLSDECQERGIKYHSLSDDGAIFESFSF